MDVSYLADFPQVIFSFNVVLKQKIKPIPMEKEMLWATRDVAALALQNNVHHHLEFENGAVK